MSKQTAIEWLTNELKNELGYGVDLGKSDQRVLDKLINQAKEMEKQQIIDAYFEGKEYGFKEKGEQYYNETFNK